MSLGSTQHLAFEQSALASMTLFRKPLGTTCFHGIILGDTSGLLGVIHVEAGAVTVAGIPVGLCAWDWWGDIEFYGILFRAGMVHVILQTSRKFSMLRSQVVPWYLYSLRSCIPTPIYCDTMSTHTPSGSCCWLEQHSNSCVATSATQWCLRS